MAAVGLGAPPGGRSLEVHGPRGVRSSPGASVSRGASHCAGGRHWEKAVGASTRVEGRPQGEKRAAWTSHALLCTLPCHLVLSSQQPCEESTPLPFDGWVNQGFRPGARGQSVSHEPGGKPRFSDDRQEVVTDEIQSTKDGAAKNGLLDQAAGAPCAGAVAGLGEDKSFVGATWATPRLSSWCLPGLMVTPEGCSGGQR